MFKLLVIGAATASAGPAAEVRLVPGQAKPAVRVRSLAADVAIPACRGVSWERFDLDSGRYVAIPAAACEPLRPALKVGDKGMVFPVDVDVSPGQVIRAVVVVGLGCTADRPFPIAGCSSVVAVEGPTITVRTQK